MNSLITVGITGGIGTGKSLICRIIDIMGYPVFYSDKAAHDLVQNDEKVISSIKELFGDKAYKAGIYNRAFISSVVFEKKEKLNELNKIIHPAVRQSFQSWSEKQKKNIVFNEAAILFETGSYKNFSKTILVTAPENVRFTRVQQRDKMSVEEFKKRISNQWSDEKKIPLADFVIENDDEQAILPQLNNILQKIHP